MSKSVDEERTVDIKFGYPGAREFASWRAHYYMPVRDVTIMQYVGKSAENYFRIIDLKDAVLDNPYLEESYRSRRDEILADITKTRFIIIEGGKEKAVALRDLFSGSDEEFEKCKEMQLRAAMERRHEGLVKSMTQRSFDLLDNQWLFPKDSDVHYTITELLGSREPIGEFSRRARTNTFLFNSIHYADDTALSNDEIILKIERNASASAHHKFQEYLRAEPVDERYRIKKLYL